MRFLPEVVSDLSVFHGARDLMGLPARLFVVWLGRLAHYDGAVRAARRFQQPPAPRSAAAPRPASVPRGDLTADDPASDPLFAAAPRFGQLAPMIKGNQL